MSSFPILESQRWFRFERKFQLKESWKILDFHNVTIIWSFKIYRIFTILHFHSNSLIYAFRFQIFIKRFSIIEHRNERVFDDISGQLHGRVNGLAGIADSIDKTHLICFRSHHFTTRQNKIQSSSLIFRLKNFSITRKKQSSSFLLIRPQKIDFFIKTFSRIFVRQSF